MRKRGPAWLVVVLLSISAAALMAADSSWLRKVPAADQRRANPFDGKPEAIAAGKLLFADHCAQCHGSDARGRRGRPNLRSPRVAQASDGELAWLLRNGSLTRGMPPGPRCRSRSDGRSSHSCAACRATPRRQILEAILSRNGVRYFRA